MKRMLTAGLYVTVATIVCVTTVLAQAPSKAPYLAPGEPVEQPPNRGFVAPAMDLSHLTGAPGGTGGQKAPMVLPDSWDWRAQSAVTAIRNQSSCGACYSFAAAGDIEAQLLIDAEGTFDFSENNIKECNYSDFSCSGGNYQGVASYLAQKGVVLESCDAYVASDVACNTGCTYIKTLTGWDRITGGTLPSVDDLKQYIYDNGPVYTTYYAGDANDPAWTSEMNSYDGSYTMHYTGTYATNHAVLIVGWDDSLTHAGGTGGWIVKNSWGTSWGGTCGYGTEGGYFTMAYGSAKIGTWSSHQTSWQDYDANEDLQYYDEAGWTTNVGWPAGTSTTAWGLAKFTPSSDMYLTDVEFWTNDVTTDVDIFVYDDFNGTAVSTLLNGKLNQSFDYAGYHSVELDSPPLISSGDPVYVVVKIDNQTAGYALVADDIGPTGADETYLSASGASGTWFDLHTSLSANAGIRARFNPSLGLSVEEIDGPLPKTFVLDQNYPNPFNPDTRIEFSVERASHVSLTVYNLLGQEVVTLVDEYLPVGNYQTSWGGRDANGNESSSGVYFYRLEAGEFAATRKMLLLR